MENNKKVAPEGQAQEQQKSKRSIEEQIAIQTFTLICNYKLSIADAKKTLEYCSSLIDANTEIVIHDNKMKLGFWFSK
ncbi:hypothetical protein [Clostridium coskatii]|uniref:Uncharacterized protein n=1 Tax=Clostridium coskatii TaxID=1705578 RepID=A0A162JBH8_9CLOT|nr:hypothetical protein [Clostridium coskatii]OAA93045.1 hypothetical protein WX73_00363 [Clostridium coskatii]OBR90788.1 hypothetical protein CLCOS_37630 [Clostridium coskatii]